jgi:hypothetical protein
MDADWSVELAADDPVIVVPWASDDGKCQFVYLGRRPQGVPANQRVDEVLTPDQMLDKIEEATSEPALRSALLALNGDLSPLWTAKCDLWLTDSRLSEDGPVDLLEMDCEPQSSLLGSSLGDGNFVAGCYIDILPRDAKAGASFEVQERRIRALSRRLRGGLARCARTDFVLRRAETWGLSGYGVTWFVEACASTSELAQQRREEALTRALPIVIEECRL